MRPMRSSCLRWIGWILLKLEPGKAVARAKALGLGCPDFGQIAFLDKFNKRPTGTAPEQDNMLE